MLRGRSCSQCAELQDEYPRAVPCPSANLCSLNVFLMLKLTLMWENVVIRLFSFGVTGSSAALDVRSPCT